MQTMTTVNPLKKNFLIMFQKTKAKGKKFKTQSQTRIKIHG